MDFFVDHNMQVVLKTMCMLSHKETMGWVLFSFALFSKPRGNVGFMSHHLTSGTTKFGLHLHIT